MASAGLLYPQIDVDPEDPAIASSIESGQYRPPSNNSLLKPMKTISDVWPEKPPDKHLHVFVGLPGGVISPNLGYDGGECFIRLFAPAQTI